MRGKADSCDLSSEAVQKQIEDLKTTMKGYPLDRIYNADETGLYYRMLPRRSYVMQVGTACNCYV